MPLNIYIINHTHWDREWFLTSIYTNALIPGLIDRLEQLIEENPEFQYLLDGQTLIIEDLLKFYPHYKKKVEALVRQGNLIIGPFYCQPDWKMTYGEALIRNLLYGQQDISRFSAMNTSSWLVDTFGHISQTPQLHHLFGLQSTYVWRGVPRLEPYFHWQGSDGSQITSINLFGGYRNLYGVTYTPEVAVQRLATEARRLQPYYPTPDIPLFDGYDLEDHPEDPIEFFRHQMDIPSDLSLYSSSPEKYSQIAYNLSKLPTIHGELISGKYGATFPGTLSSRNYLKVMANDCELLLYKYCEPVAALASLLGRPYPSERFEQLARTLLQNSIHDCLCGVSIDLVHEKMEYTYYEVFKELRVELSSSLSLLLDDFLPNTYAVSTNSFTYDGWQAINDRLIHVKTIGIGVWPIEEVVPIVTPNKPVTNLNWRNDHYDAEVLSDGSVRLGRAKLGALAIFREEGDTYSEEPGDVLGICHPTEMVIVQSSDQHCELRISYSETWEDVKVNVDVRVTFDASPLIRWAVDLDTIGTDFRVEMVFESNHDGQIYAGMPFDIVQRPENDYDLLPRDLEINLNGLLLGQREVGMVSSFPFHEFIAISNGSTTSGVFAKGLHSYQAWEKGRITIILRRSVEWLTRSNLNYRVGDAGPLFYVPDARCERHVKHELAFATGNFGVTDIYFQKLNASFQNPPMVVQSRGSGEKTEWQFFQENIKLDNLQRSGDKIIARLHNPGWQEHYLKKSYNATDVWGNDKYPLNKVPPKKILTLALDSASSGAHDRKEAAIEILNPPTWRVSQNQGLPDPKIVKSLKLKINQLKDKIKHLEDKIQQSSGYDRYHLEHHYYVLRREMYEHLLSTRLNELKLEMGGNLDQDYLFKANDEIMAIGLELNRMRIKRRIFDYVVQLPRED